MMTGPARQGLAPDQTGNERTVAGFAGQPGRTGRLFSRLHLTRIKKRARKTRNSDYQYVPEIAAGRVFC
jgi:hypothetical protein